MGLFQSIGQVLGKGIEKAGNFLGSSTITNLGKKIQDTCAEKIGSESSYNKIESNFNETDRLNETLVSFSDGYDKQAAAIENSCIRQVEYFYNDLIKMLETLPNSSSNQANLSALKRGKKRIRQNISGGIREPLSKRMSLDDKECQKILSMDSGAEKTKAMSSFSQKVIKEALRNLSKKVRVSMDEQLDNIEDYLRNISEVQEKEYLSLKKSFDNMCSSGMSEAKEREIHCVDSLIMIEAIDLIDKIL